MLKRIRLNKFLLLTTCVLLAACSSNNDKPSKDLHQKSEIDSSSIEQNEKLPPINHLGQLNINGSVKYISTYNESNPTILFQEKFFDTKGWLKKHLIYHYLSRGMLEQKSIYKYFLDDSVQCYTETYNGFDTLTDIADIKTETYYFNKKGEIDSVWVNKELGFGRDYGIKKTYLENGKLSKELITYPKTNNKILKDSPKIIEEIIYTYQDNIQRINFYSDESDEKTTIVNTLDSNSNILTTENSQVLNEMFEFEYLNIDKYKNWRIKKYLKNKNYLMSEKRNIEYY